MNLLGSIRNGVRNAAAVVTRRSAPISISFIVTNRCNLACDYCNIPAAGGDEMSTRELCRAIDELVAGGMMRASFSGGEAFLRADLVTLIRHAKRRGSFTSVNTNGWHVRDHLDELAGQLDMLVVSLDGPRDIHDASRGRPGSFERAAHAIAGAIDRGISVATVTVIGPWNIDRLDEVLDETERLGATAFFQPAHLDCFRNTRGLHPVFDAERLRSIAAFLERSRRAGRPVAASAGFTDRLRRGPHFGDCTSCNAGRFFATLLPDGRMIPCHLTEGDHDYANGREVGFLEAFHALPRPSPGPGCAIAPYQESDLIFALDRRALLSAASRVARPVVARWFRRS